MGAMYLQGGGIALVSIWGLFYDFYACWPLCLAGIILGVGECLIASNLEKPTKKGQ